MAAIRFDESSISVLKRSLWDNYSAVESVKSSHVSEALARALGEKTHAALLARLRAPLTSPAHAYRWLDSVSFYARLEELCHESFNNEDFDEFEEVPHDAVIKTVAPHIYTYKGPREQAWRNVMVAGINAGIAAGLVTIAPGGNHWPVSADASTVNSGRASGCGRVAFQLDSYEGLAQFEDVGFGELSVTVVVKPSVLAQRHAQHLFLDFACGEAVAHGWLERRDGAWLQSSPSRFTCRRALQASLAALQVPPMCFGDSGRVIL